MEDNELNPAGWDLDRVYGCWDHGTSDEYRQPAPLREFLSPGFTILPELIIAPPGVKVLPGQIVLIPGSDRDIVDFPEEEGKAIHVGERLVPLGPDHIPASETLPPGFVDYLLTLRPYDAVHH